MFFRTNSSKNKFKDTKELQKVYKIKIKYEIRYLLHYNSYLLAQK